MSCKLRFLFAVLWVVIPMTIFAQQPTAAEKRRMNLRLLELVETYESSLRTSRSFPFSKFKRRFISLHSNKQDSLVYSDLMDFKPGTRMSVEEYAKQLEVRQHLMCAISNLKKGDYIQKDGKWHISLSLDKTVTYYVSNDSKVENPPKSMVYFSSLDYYKQPYKITLNCSYDPVSDTAKIESVDGTINSSVPMLQDGFYVVQRSGKKDARFKIEGAPGDSLSFNSDGQAFVARDAIKPWNEDVVLKVQTIADAQTFSHVKLDYTTTHWRAKLRFMTTLGSAFRVQSNEDIKSTKNNAIEVGVDLGYTIPMGGKTTMGLYTGLGLSSSTLQLNYGKPMEYNYRMSDADGVRYVRQYSISSVSEGVKYRDVVIPLYLGFDHKLYEKLYLNWQLGVKFYVNGAVKVNPYTIAGDVTAVYGDGQTISEREYDAIGSISGTYNKFLYPGSYTRDAVDASLLGGLGMSYDIFKGRLFAFLKFGYEVGLTTVHEGLASRFYDTNSRTYPIVYSGKINQNIATQSLINCVSFSRQAAWLELGLTYKF